MKFAVSIFLTDQTVMAVPANNHVTGTNSRIVPEGPEFWTTPCGEPVVDEYDPTLSDAEVAATFALELDIELNNVNQWKDNYVDHFILYFVFINEIISSLTKFLLFEV